MCSLNLFWCQAFYLLSKWRHVELRYERVDELTWTHTYTHSFPLLNIKIRLARQACTCTFCVWSGSIVILWAASQLNSNQFSFNHTFMRHTGSIPPLSGFPCGVTGAFSPPCRVLFFGCPSWGRESWLNEWLSYRHPLLPSLTCFLPQIATSLSLPLLISLPLCENSFIPVWTGIWIAVRQKTRERGNKSK